MLTKKEAREVLDVAILAGQIMLENGAETYRVEEAIDQICFSRGLFGVNSFTVPTGIFVSFTFLGEDFSYVRRIRVSAIDLHIISMVHTFFKEFVASDMSCEKAMQELRDIQNIPHFKPLFRYVAGGVAGGFFTLLFGGTTLEFFLAFITSFLVVLTSHQISKRTRAFFLKSLGGGVINGVLVFLLTDLFALLGYTVDPGVIIIGSIMPLVPGVAMTNAFRDTISGDFISGVSKLAEALGIAIAIALGVAVVLQARLFLAGGIL